MNLSQQHRKLYAWLGLFASALAYLGDPTVAIVLSVIVGLPCMIAVCSISIERPERRVRRKIACETR